MTEEDQRIEVWSEFETIIGKLVGEVGNLADFFNLVLDKGLRLIDAQSGFIAFVEEKRGELTIIASTREGEIGQRLSLKDTPVGQIFERGNPLSVLIQVQPYATDMKPRPGQSNPSVLVTMIKDNDQNIGVLVFEIPRQDAFDSQRQHIASTLALLSAIAIHQHNTSRRELERERLLAEGRFATDVVHRLNNPMGAIRTWILQAKADCGDLIEQNPDLKEALYHIQVNAEKTMALVRDLREKSRDAQAKEVDMAQSLKLVFDDLELKSSINVERRILDKPVMVHADEQLTRVFSNLIMNAIEAMPAGGYLEVGIGIEGNFGVGWVRDAGRGIPLEYHTEIFKDWFSTKAESSAHGFGLWWVKNYLEAYHGEIKVDSKVGEGTTMTIRLPLARVVHAQQSSEGENEQ
jgi:signal transduction histidine kinase